MIARTLPLAPSTPMRIRLGPPLTALAVVLVLACRTAESARAGDPALARAEIEAVLDEWHRAAARADGARYFGAMAADCVYLGTDASERWSAPEFRAFCEPYFAQGTGWTYEPRERHVRVEGELAWFDERLWNDKYGECRGTGVLRRHGGVWQIVHYSLTFPIPNELAAQVVELIRAR